jgi:hypothetical protein
MTRRYAYRRWWYSPRELILWASLTGCCNFERHPTWRLVR